MLNLDDPKRAQTVRALAGILAAATPAADLVLADVSKALGIDLETQEVNA